MLAEAARYKQTRRNLYEWIQVQRVLIAAASCHEIICFARLRSMRTLEV